MTTTRLKINGMQCEACVAHVEKALEAVSGVQSVQVDLTAGQAIVQHEGADENAMLRAVAEEGYEAQPDGGA